MFENLFRVAAVTPRVHIGNVGKNCEEIKSYYRELGAKADVIITPELSMTGYTCADLFTNRNLLMSVEKELIALAEFTKECEAEQKSELAALVVGLPFELEGELFNCAAFIQGGEILAIIPKTYLPNYGEFYEKRWFSARKYDDKEITLWNGKNVVFGNNVIIEMGAEQNKVRLGIEICEDAWTPVSPGRMLALNGAEILLNISASNELIGKAQYRRSLVGGISSGCICGYAYVSAGRYESTSDIVFSGHNLMYENGKLLGEVKPFEEGVLIKDFNLTKIRHDRLANKSFADCKRDFGKRYYVTVSCGKKLMEKNEILAKVPITPFVPSLNKLESCLAIFDMQVAGLQRRLETTKSKCIVVGVSGGLDSTLALLVSAKAVKNLGLPSKTVLGITMPGFGTTNRTKNNSIELMKILGCEIREISIVDSVRQHFKDIGQSEDVHDITYENCQARERTQILMDVSNKEGGFVVGTGDLSELALGWCTYNGDHMSMYAVNTSIPKTLVRTLVDEVGHYLEDNGFTGIKAVIEDIVDTPVSPELLPPNADGTIAQKTEDTVGSYILHDFFLYYTLRYGMTPEEIFELCKHAVAQSEEYKFSDEEIKKWQKVFYTRFFRQQFKRNCMPDGVKVGTVSVSPRGDLRLPSEVEFEEYI
ncbi:MAG: NAD(+) synthase [Lachnospiraceae bacterium]|nr:NAD(+) synthase [Lachnospiraceae bacterium]